MWFFLLVILLLVVIISYYFYYVQSFNTKSTIIRNKIRELYSCINNVCYRCNITVRYRLLNDSISFIEKIETNEETHDENQYIFHIPLWNEAVQRCYTIDSLLIVLFNHIAQVTRCNMDELTAVAQQLGYYDEHRIIEPIINLT